MGKDNRPDLDESIRLQQKFSLGKGLITKVKFKQSHDTIIKLKEDGFTLRSIWAYLTEHQMFDCSYQHFVRLYYSCFNHQAISGNPDAPSQEAASNSAIGTKTTSQNKTFDFSPTPNKDELI